MELDGAVAAAEMVQKSKKKKRLTIGGSAAGAVEEVKGYQLPERDRIVYHHYPLFSFRC